jgi:hypothetical protein
MLEVQIRPIDRKPMPDDPTRRMWHTDVFVKKTLLSRRAAVSGNAVIAGMLASAKTAQLGG